MNDNCKELRDGICKELGITLYGRYGEEDTAAYVGVDRSTLKRWRKRKLVPHIEYPGGTIRYFGIHVAYIIIFGKEAKERFERDDTQTESQEV